MATDGVKIIDGDTANGIYYTFMKKYDEGSSIDELKQQYESEKQQYFFYPKSEYEIFITVYAFAFWEIGELTNDLLKEVETVIKEGAGVKDWIEEVGESAGKARQKELDKLLSKISKPRRRPIKRVNLQKAEMSGEEIDLLFEATCKTTDEAIEIYKQLLSKNPLFHDVRYQYIELLVDIKDWVEVEKNSDYMLRNRDTDRNEATQRKKKKIFEWYVTVQSSLCYAFANQEKYKEAIIATEEFIQFTESMSHTDFMWIINDLGLIFKYYYLMNDMEGLELFKEKCRTSYPQLENHGKSWEEIFISWTEIATRKYD